MRYVRFIFRPFCFPSPGAIISCANGCLSPFYLILPVALRNSFYSPMGGTPTFGPLNSPRLSKTLNYFVWPKSDPLRWSFYLKSLRLHSVVSYRPITFHHSPSRRKDILSLCFFISRIFTHVLRAPYLYALYRMFRFFRFVGHVSYFLENSGPVSITCGSGGPSCGGVSRVSAVAALWYFLACTYYEAPL